MAEFKTLREKTVTVENTEAIGEDPEYAVMIRDTSIVSKRDVEIQKDRVMRNDDIVINLFKYVRELKAMNKSNISINDVVRRLRDGIISDYPIEVRRV